MIGVGRLVSGLGSRWAAPWPENERSSRPKRRRSEGTCRGAASTCLHKEEVGGQTHRLHSPPWSADMSTLRRASVRICTLCGHQPVSARHERPTVRVGAAVWLETTWFTRLFGWHRSSVYRWPVAIASFLVLPVAFGPLYGPWWVVPITGLPVVALWALPGSRPGTGFDHDDVVIRGWIRERRVPWSDVQMIRFGILKHVGKGRLPGAVLCLTRGRMVSLARTPCTVRGGARSFIPLVAEARRRGIIVAVDQRCHRRFPTITPDEPGRASYRWGRWVIRPNRWR